MAVVLTPPAVLVCHHYAFPSRVIRVFLMEQTGCSDYDEGMVAVPDSTRKFSSPRGCFRSPKAGSTALKTCNKGCSSAMIAQPPSRGGLSAAGTSMAVAAASSG